MLTLLCGLIAAAGADSPAPVMNTLLQVLAVLRHLLRAVARRNVLRAVPVKRLQMKKKQTFNAGAIVGRRHLRQQLRVVLCRRDLDGGVDFQPARRG